MQEKSQAHKSFSLLSQREGVLLVIVMHGAKEQMMGLFRKKAKEAEVKVNQTEPYSPWSNVAEGAIKETK